MKYMSYTKYALGEVLAHADDLYRITRIRITLGVYVYQLKLLTAEEKEIWEVHNQ